MVVDSTIRKIQAGTIWLGGGAALDIVMDGNIPEAIIAQMICGLSKQCEILNHVKIWKVGTHLSMLMYSKKQQ